MAYDPEARKDSNTALIAGVAALILVIAAVAYFATRQPETVDNTIVVTPSTAPATNTNTVIEQVPVVVDAPTAAPVIIQAEPRVIERNTTTTTTNNRVTVATPAPNAGTGDTEGAPNGAAGNRGSTNTNVTVNVPAANSSPANNPTRAPAARNNGGVNVEGNAPPAGDSGY